MLLRHHVDQGLSKTAIAERVGISRRTILSLVGQGSAALRLGGEHGHPLFRPGATNLRPSKPLIRERPKVTFRLEIHARLAVRSPSS